MVARVAAAVRPLPAHVQALVKRFQAMQRRPRAAMGKVRSAFYILSSSVVGSRSWSSGHSCWYPCVVCQRRRYQQPAHHLSCRLPRAFLMIASLVRAGSAEVPPAPPRTAVFLPLVAVTASGELRTNVTPFPARQPSKACSRRASAALSAPVSSAHAQGRRAGATLCTPSSCAMTTADLRLQAAATQRRRRGQR